MNKILNCIIIDDEPLARKGLKEYIADVEFLHLSGDFDNPLKATSALNSQQIDLVFLDIQMPKITGLDWLRSLHHQPPFIITTAYPQYALDGFELNALDYLVKPVSFDRFLKAATKAQHYYLSSFAQAPTQPGLPGHQYFFVKANNKLTKIAFDDIVFIEALENYVSIQTKEKKYVSYITFKQVEEYLPQDNFVKTHKSFIVAASKVDSIDGNVLYLGQYQVPISRNLKDVVLEKLLNGKYLKR